MSTLVLTHGRPQGRRRFRFFRPVREFFDGLRLARAMAHRYDVLAGLSNAELAERGIKREDIPTLVVNGKYDV
jgi:hypothetical protein